MKRIFTIILAVFFGFATAGITVSKHYCGGKLASIALFHNGGCTCGDMEDDSNCCKNETEVVKVTGNYLTSAVEHISIISTFTFICSHYSFTPLLHYFTAPLLSNPPPLLSRSASILFQTFIL